jgi:NO-binding membrane sensor protein with MHYT domain
MLGFSVVGTPIRYQIGETAVSAVLAVVAVGIGLSIVFFGSRWRAVRIAVGGLFAGLGVAAMHYTGMAAMRLNGDISYASTRVIASIVIAIIAATVALWLTSTVQRPAAILASAMVMGVAVNGMHFTGMSAMSVRPEPPAPVRGADASTLLIPIGVAVLFGLLGLVYALMAAPTDEDRAALAYLDARLAQADAAPAPRPAAGGLMNPSPVPRQRSAGRPSSLGSGWTYRDRARDRN